MKNNLFTVQKIILFVIILVFQPFYALAHPEKKCNLNHAPHFAKDTLGIITAHAKPNFTIEIAVSEEQLEYGLMCRTSLSANQGMLFDFKTAQFISMWMKNTFIPLDILFIDASGHIVAIKENAEPLSETIIASGKAVRWVLELKAGNVHKYAFTEGDKVEKGSFK